MAFFVGEYQQVMDSKNRVFIPAKYREIMGERVYITCNLDGCLSVYGEEGWQKCCEKVLSIPESDGSDFSRFFFSNAMDAKPDAQGRIVLTPALRDHAGLEKDIYVIGAGDHAEIWDKAARDEKKNDAAQIERYREIRRQNRI